MKHFLRLLLLPGLLLASAVCLPAARGADLSITAANVLASAKADYQDGIAGATLTRGQLVYSDAADGGKIKLADANVLAAKGVLGMAYGDAAAGQFVRVIIKDPELTVGATLSMSSPVYALSATPGGIAAVGDITTGWYPIPVLVAISTTKANFNPRALAGTAAAVAP